MLEKLFERRRKVSSHQIVYRLGHSIVARRTIVLAPFVQNLPNNIFHIWKLKINTIDYTRSWTILLRQSKSLLVLYSQVKLFSHYCEYIQYLDELSGKPSPEAVKFADPAMLISFGQNGDYVVFSKP